MRLRVVTLSGALLGAMFGGPAHAQPANAPTPQIPLFQVEIIVFAHRDFDTGEERFPQQLVSPPSDPSQSLLELPLYVEPTPPPTADAALGAAAEPPSPPPEDPLALRLLPAEQLQLNTEYRKLKNLGAYTPLLHAGWVQPGLPEDQSPALDLTMLGVANPRGTVRVYLSRFLHVKLDLTYRDGAASSAAAEPAGEALQEVTLAPRYRLVTERQIRSGELHYFDHPAFGVLVKVTAVPTTPTGSTRRRPAA